MGQTQGTEAVATLADLPPGTKAPPPKKPASAGSSTGVPFGAGRATLAFVPSAVRSKKPVAVAGGVVQVSSASLHLANRKTLLFSEAPKVKENVDMDAAFGDFMSALSGDNELDDDEVI